MADDSETLHRRIAELTTEIRRLREQFQARDDPGERSGRRVGNLGKARVGKAESKPPKPRKG
jgi:hypothetical protein